VLKKRIIAPMYGLSAISKARRQAQDGKVARQALLPNKKLRRIEKPNEQET